MNEAFKDHLIAAARADGLAGRKLRELGKFAIGRYLTAEEMLLVNTEYDRARNERAAGAPA